MAPPATRSSKGLGRPRKVLPHRTKEELRTMVRHAMKEVVENTRVEQRFELLDMVTAEVQKRRNSTRRQLNRGDAEMKDVDVLENEVEDAADEVEEIENEDQEIHDDEEGNVSDGESESSNHKPETEGGKRKKFQRDLE